MFFKKKIVVTGGTGRFAQSLKKIRSKYKFIYPSSKKLNIINLSSIADRMILPESFAYSICSAAVNQLTKSMAVALADKGIRVNAVAMGSIMSTSLREMIREDLDLHDQVKSATPLGRIGDSDEAASAVLFLASAEAKFITGQILTIDGGRTLTENIGVPAY